VLVHPHKEEFDATDGRKTVVATLKRCTQEPMHIEVANTANYVSFVKDKSSGEVSRCQKIHPATLHALCSGTCATGTCRA
jgi:hypothetical protein